MSTATTTVSNTNTALAMGSGSLEVFATPAMVALMEEAATKAVSEFMTGSLTTVGTMMSIKHVSATPVGMLVTAEAEILEQDGRRFLLHVTARDEKGIIGEGTHERVAVDAVRFMTKTLSKLQSES